MSYTWNRLEKPLYVNSINLLLSFQRLETTNWFDTRYRVCTLLQFGI